FREGGTNGGVQRRRKLGVHYPLADLRAGFRQGVDVIDIEGVEDGVDTLVESALVEEVTIGLGGGGEAARYRNAGAGQVTDHLAQGGVLAPYPLDVMVAELIEGNYVLNQGDLSIDCFWISPPRRRM